MMTKILEVLHVGAAAMALMVATGCAASSPNTSGETHFVTCHETSECLAKLGPDFACVDEVCKPSLDGSLGSGGSGGAGATGGSGGSATTSGGASSGSGGAASSRLCKTLADDSGDTDASTVASILGDAAASCDIEPSSYDQSCKVDADCTVVGFGNLCEVPCGVQCANSAINVRSLAQYQADYAKNPAAACGPFFCGCGAEGEPVCRGGKCQLSSLSGPTDGGTSPLVDSGPP
ncbi:MAG TPA: hypothetical protein VH142_14775 [Polyangiaceae bacterium]|jgi:hypothetical protein|nr:hypothetical protein [Polyangiaceae bacterium]